MRGRQPTRGYQLRQWPDGFPGGADCGEPRRGLALENVRLCARSQQPLL